MKKIGLFLFLAAFGFNTFAQAPKKSPTVTAQGELATIKYGQPSKRERVIFGGLVPYDKVWRTGANEATEITFPTDVVFGGKPVKAGTYSLFTIPTKKGFSVILNSSLKQWGAYEYEKIKSANIVEIERPIITLPEPVEAMTFQVREDFILFVWDTTGFNIPIAKQ